jgi:hypothetical protein
MGGGGGGGTIKFAPKIKDQIYDWIYLKITH